MHEPVSNASNVKNPPSSFHKSTRETSTNQKKIYKFSIEKQSLCLPWRLSWNTPHCVCPPFYGMLKQTSDIRDAFDADFVRESASLLGQVNSIQCDFILMIYIYIYTWYICRYTNVLMLVYIYIYIWYIYIYCHTFIISLYYVSPFLCFLGGPIPPFARDDITNVSPFQGVTGEPPRIFALAEIKKDRYSRTAPAAPRDPEPSHVVFGLKIQELLLSQPGVSHIVSLKHLEIVWGCPQMFRNTGPLHFWTGAAWETCATEIPQQKWNNSGVHPRRNL